MGYPAETMTYADFVDDLALLTQAESWLHILEQAAGSIGLNLKSEFMCCKQDRSISS